MYLKTNQILFDTENEKSVLSDKLKYAACILYSEAILLYPHRNGPGEFEVTHWIILLQDQLWHGVVVLVRVP